MIELLQFPPFIVYSLGALLVPLFKGNSRKAFLILVSLFSLAQVFLLKQQVSWVFKFMGFELTLLYVDKLSLVFGYVYVMIGFLAVLYSLRPVKEAGEHMAALLYVGSSLGVIFAGDFLTFYIFWEIMAISSTFLVWYRGGAASINAGFRYLLMHIFGGILLLAGIILHYMQTGSLSVGLIREEEGLAHWLAMFGMGLNTAFAGVHFWLPDAYPRSTVAGGVFMSVYTTKTGVYALARSFPGVDFVAYMGRAMVVYGVIFALMQNDTRKVLSYHIMSQVGYMVAGVGIGGALGVCGGIAHVFNHILYKGLLFMTMGSVIYATGIRYLTQLGGLGRYMPVTALACVIASFSISGVPGFNGYVSKGMVIEAAHEEGMPILEAMGNVGAVGTWLSFMKLSYFTFFGRGREWKDVKEVPISMQISMLITALLCILFGVYPQLLFNWLPYHFEYHPYSLAHVSGVSQLLVLTAIIFTLRLVWFEPHARVTYELDYVYRRFGNSFIWFCLHPSSGLGRVAERVFFVFTPNALLRFLNFWNYVVDLGFVDGIINGISKLTILLGGIIRKIQTGDVQGYAAIFILGLAILAIILMFWVI